MNAYQVAKWSRAQLSHLYGDLKGSSWGTQKKKKKKTKKKRRRRGRKKKKKEEEEEEDRRGEWKENGERPEEKEKQNFDFVSSWS